MPQNIQWTFHIQVQGGPSIASADTLSTEAYQKIQVTIVAGDTDKVIDLPSGASLLIVTSSQYSDGIRPTPTTYKVSYKINNAGDDIEFTSALLLIGKQVVEAFAPPPPPPRGLTSLSFTNNLTNDIVIDILTATDATP